MCGCGLVVRKGVISHHFRALKKVERPRTAHFRKRLKCRWARFMLGNVMIVVLGSDRERGFHQQGGPKELSE